MVSSKPVFEKLGLKPGHRAAKLYIPKDVEKSLGDPPSGGKLDTSLSGEFDFLLCFYDSSKDLKGDLTRIRKVLKKSGMAWVCWRKGNVTDLSRDSLAALVQATTSLEGVSSRSINDDWSALKFMYPKDQRELE